MLQRQRCDLNAVFMDGQIDFKPHAEVAREVDAGINTYIAANHGEGLMPVCLLYTSRCV